MNSTQKLILEFKNKHNNLIKDKDIRRILDLDKDPKQYNNLELKFREFAKKKNIYSFHLKLKDMCIKKKHKDIRIYAKELGISTREKTKNKNSELICNQILEKLDLLSNIYPNINICKSKILELSLQRKPELKKFPNWAVFIINDVCINIFDLEYLIRKKKVKFNKDVELQITNNIDFVNTNFNFDDNLVHLFMYRQTSILENKFNYEPIITLLRASNLIIEKPKNSTCNPPQIMNIRKKSSEKKEGFRFPKNFTSDYYNYKTMQRKEYDDIFVDDLNDGVIKNINKCKRFILNLCNSTGRHVNENELNIKLQKEIKQTHFTDTNSQSIVTLGYTRIICDKKSVFDESHNCSSIVIKETPLSVFKMTLIHELIHSEIHERRSHPLQSKLERSMSTNNKFEEGICVLGEFLASGLQLNPKGEFKRTRSTDEYMQRLACKEYLDVFGNDKTIKSGQKHDYEKKYCSGFALALDSMVKNKLTYLELLEYYIINGVFQ